MNHRIHSPGLLLILLLLSGCTLFKKKAKTVEVPYELSVDRKISTSDMRVQEFLWVVRDHPLRSKQIPEAVSRSAKKHIDLLGNLPDNQKELQLINYEIFHFYLLDRYLLPAYKASGDPAIEDQILHCLVELRELSSHAELHLQAKCLFAISQGGYYYPELQSFLASAIQKELDTGNSKHSGIRDKLEKAQSLILTLESNHKN